MKAQGKGCRRGWMTARGSISCLLSCLWLLCVSVPSGRAEGTTREQELVDRATRTVRYFHEKRCFGWKKTSKQAWGILIVPRLVRVGAVLGGAGGKGVLLVRDPETGAWSDPAFYTVSLISYGAQAGVDVSDLVVIIKSQEGNGTFDKTSFKLGGDLSVALVREYGTRSGSSVSGQGSDLVGYTYGWGVYLGLTVDGALVTASGKYNKAYYGADVRPEEILAGAAEGNPGAEALREAVEAATRPAPTEPD